MGTVFHKVVTRPIPTGAVINRRPDGSAAARWTPRSPRPLPPVGRGRHPRRWPAGHPARERRLFRSLSRLGWPSTRRIHRMSRRGRGASVPRRVRAAVRADSLRRHVTGRSRRRRPRRRTDQRPNRRLPRHLDGLGEAPEGHRARPSPPCCRTPLASRLADMGGMTSSTGSPTSAGAGDGRPIRSARSANADQTAAATFAGWCVKVGRLTANPFGRMPKANLDADRRRPRRAFQPRRTGSGSWTPPKRPQNGLRRDPPEGDAVSSRRPAQRLSPGRQGRPVCVPRRHWPSLERGPAGHRRRPLPRCDGPLRRLQAAITKNRRADTVPLRSDLVHMLRQRITGRRPGDPVFDIPADLIKRFHADCRRGYLRL